MFLVPALLASALTIDFRGVGVVTPWKSPSENSARIWVFLPDAARANVMPHRARLLLPRDAVVEADWSPNSIESDGTGVWNLTGYVLSVQRPGVQDNPQDIRMPGPFRERAPWTSLHWLFDLDRLSPDSRLISNPFANGVTYAAVKLSAGDVFALPPSSPLVATTMFTVLVDNREEMHQHFTDTFRYRFELPNQAAIQLRLEPIPGGSGAAKTIRLRPVTDRTIAARVEHLPDPSAARPPAAPASGRGSAPTPATARAGHGPAVTNLFSDSATRALIPKIKFAAPDFGGDPLCDWFIVNLKPIPPSPGPCEACAISMTVRQ